MLNFSAWPYRIHFFLFESALAGLTADVDGNVNEWNDKTAEITGFSKEEAMNYPLVSTFIVPKLRQSVQEVLDNALRGEGTSNYELEFRTKSNEIRYLLVNATTRRDAENNIVGVVGVAQVSSLIFMIYLFGFGFFFVRSGLLISVFRGN